MHVTSARVCKARLRRGSKWSRKIHPRGEIPPWIVSEGYHTSYGYLCICTFAHSRNHRFYARDHALLQRDAITFLWPFLLNVHHGIPFIRSFQQSPKLLLPQMTLFIPHSFSTKCLRDYFAWFRYKHTREKIQRWNIFNLEPLISMDVNFT